jgi:hypothetical protein
MRIGVDFDNTIVSYEGVFHKIALAGGLIPPECGEGKDDVRNFLREAGHEDDWTALQGLVYGGEMEAPIPYSGAIAFFRTCCKLGVPVFIISHKTRFPYLGPQRDLHEAAYGWLQRQGFFDPKCLSLGADQVFFELTQEDKLHRVEAMACTHFIDDLPEFLGGALFPSRVEKVLFDPRGQHGGANNFIRCEHWNDIAGRLLNASAIRD